MKASFVVFGISAFATAAQATTFPACLQSCADAVFSASGCSSGDFKCVCTGSGHGKAGATSFGNISSCQGAKTCSTSDLEAWSKAWGSACEQYDGALISSANAQFASAQAQDSAAQASMTMGSASSDAAGASSTAPAAATDASATSGAATAATGSSAAAGSSAATGSSAVAGSSATGSSAAGASAASGSSSGASATSSSGQSAKSNAAAPLKVEGAGVLAAAAAMYFAF